MDRTIVIYFSASGITRTVAKNLSKSIEADIFEIKPKVPYKPQDLNWLDKNSRSSVEMRDKSSRPEIEDIKLNIDEYDRIFLGFPIWWYIAPTIVNTFLEKFDFSNKKIILFATSGGSGFGETAKYLKSSVSQTCEIVTGKIFSVAASEETLKSWAQSV